MAPLLNGKGAVRRGKHSIGSSPKKPTQYTAVTGSWTSISKSGTISKGKGKGKKSVVGATRYSPRKRQTVQLIETSTTQLPGPKNQQRVHQPVEKCDNETSQHTQVHTERRAAVEQIRRTLRGEPARRSPRKHNQPQCRPNDEAMESMVPETENEGDLMDVDSGRVDTNRRTEGGEPKRKSPRKNYQPQSRNTEEAMESMPQEMENGNSMNEIDNGGGAATTAKVKRGPTRSLETIKKTHHGGKIMKVTVPKHAMRFVGEFSQKLTTEIGCVVRDIAPPHIKQWKEIDKPTMDAMLERLKNSFDFGEEAHTHVALLAQMRRMFRNWRYRLRVHFEQFETEEEALSNCPHAVTEDEWRYCIERFKSEKFQKISNINKKNRGAERTNHCSGNKSFARIIHDSIAEDDPESDHAFDRFDLWYVTHFNMKKSKWVDERSKEVFEKLCAIRDAHEEYPDLSVQEIFDMVLPPKSGYIPGMGVGPKRKRTKSLLERELEESKKREKDARAREEEAREREEQTRKRNEDLEARLALMEKAIGVVEKLQHRFDTLERDIGLTPGWDATHSHDA